MTFINKLAIVAGILLSILVASPGFAQEPECEANTLEHCTQVQIEALVADAVKRHVGKYHSLDDKKRVASALLNATPWSCPDILAIPAIVEAKGYESQVAGDLRAAQEICERAVAQAMAQAPVAASVQPMPARMTAPVQPSYTSVRFGDDWWVAAMRRARFTLEDMAVGTTCAQRVEITVRNDGWIDVAPPVLVDPGCTCVNEERIALATEAAIDGVFFGRSDDTPLAKWLDNEGLTLEDKRLGATSVMTDRDQTGLGWNLDDAGFGRTGFITITTEDRCSAQRYSEAAESTKTVTKSSGTGSLRFEIAAFGQFTQAAPNAEVHGAVGLSFTSGRLLVGGHILLGVEPQDAQLIGGGRLFVGGNVINNDNLVVSPGFAVAFTGTAQRGDHGGQFATRPGAFLRVGNNWVSGEIGVGVDLSLRDNSAIIGAQGHAGLVFHPQIKGF